MARASSVEARHLMRAKARSFHLASLFLPARTRRDVQIVYAYYRTIDDLVDEPPKGWTQPDILEALAHWEEGIDGGWYGRLARRPYVSPLLPPLLEVVHRYNIPIPYLAMVLEGARFDLGMRCVETREDLLRYAVLVAGSVGIVMAHILGARSEEALAAACDLGVAMQLTNVLRDVGEDLRRDRVYLPRADLLRVGLSPDSLHTRNVTPALRSVMSELIEEARERYRHGMRGIPQLDPSARFAISLAATLYSRILDKIERRDFDVFSERAHLGNLEKWTLMMTAYLQQGQLETDR